ncbi:MAG: hypothetical protein M0005_13945 [Actinomycetota bacterium]|nr:hypothetical protein [Actinomycetota bacterium]
MVVLARRDTPRVLPGTLITLRRRCGKPTCRCARGAPHETPALSYSVGGRSKMLTLRPEEVKLVGAAVGRYRKAVEGLQAEAYAELERFVAGARARREGDK